VLHSPTAQGLDAVDSISGAIFGVMDARRWVSLGPCRRAISCGRTPGRQLTGAGDAEKLPGLTAHISQSSNLSHAVCGETELGPAHGGPQWTRHQGVPVSSSSRGRIRWSNRAPIAGAGGSAPARSIAQRKGGDRFGRARRAGTLLGTRPRFPWGGLSSPTYDVIRPERLFPCVVPTCEDFNESGELIKPREGSG